MGGAGVIKVQNVKLKVGVLERLAAIVDPTIAGVLNEISQDLQKAA